VEQINNFSKSTLVDFRCPANEICRIFAIEHGVERHLPYAVCMEDGVEWSHDRWRHVTLKGQIRDPITFEAPYLRNYDR